MELIILITVLSWGIVNADNYPESTWDDILAKVAYLRNQAPVYVCPDLVLKKHEGVISSPYYPGSYPTHVSCVWHIEGNEGDIITVTMNVVDIEESCCCKSQPCCIYNWLKMGSPVNGTEKVFCGKNPKSQSIVFHTHKIWIKFLVSKFVFGGQGFQFHYKITQTPQHNCTGKEFQCRNKACVPENVRCNGVADCKDSTDEHNCSSRCLSGHSCRSVLQCYEASKHCDGISDCADFSDELGCSFCAPKLVRCGANSTQCYDPVAQRCDRIYHCSNGEDEKDCFNLCPGKIMCDSNRGCYLPKHRCDGVAQCEDASDEKKCGAELCNYEHGGFLCDNHRCIQQVWTCDHSDDCGDGSDERRCLRNSVLTAAVMGSLICALLLVIAISCICRLHALRMLENRLMSRETPLSRLSQDFLFREPPPSYAVAVEDQQHRNLCVENLHYGSPVHHNRRRSGHSRRHRRPGTARQVPSVSRNHAPGGILPVNLPAEAGISGDSNVIQGNQFHQHITQRCNGKNEDTALNALQRAVNIPKDSSDKDSSSEIESICPILRPSSQNENGIPEPTNAVTNDTESSCLENSPDHYYCDNDSEPLV